MHLCTINDFARVHEILTHKSIYPYISDDYAPKVPDSDIGKSFLLDARIKVLMPNDDSIFVFIPMSMNVYSMHSNVLPLSRGRKGINAGIESINGYLITPTVLL